MLPAPVASAQEPTKSSTAPYPSRPKTPPNDDPLPATRRTPDSAGPTTAETPLKIAVLASARPAYSGLPLAQSDAARGHVDEKPPLCNAAIVSTSLNTKRTITYQGAEDEGEEIQLRGRGREAPEEEGDEAAAQRTREHDPRVRELVAQVAEHDLADDGGRVEDGQDNRRRQRGGKCARETRDVE